MPLMILGDPIYKFVRQPVLENNGGNPPVHHINGVQNCIHVGFEDLRRYVGGKVFEINIFFALQFFLDEKVARLFNEIFIRENGI